MQAPVRLRNVIRANLALRRHILQPLLSPGDIDDAVDDRVSDVYTLRRELPRDRIAQRTQCPLAAGEGGHLRVGFDTRCGASENEGRRVFGIGVGGRLEEEGERGLGEDEGSFAIAIRIVSDPSLKSNNRTTPKTVRSSPHSNPKDPEP